MRQLVPKGRDNRVVWTRFGDRTHKNHCVVKCVKTGSTHVLSRESVLQNGDGNQDKQITVQPHDIILGPPADDTHCDRVPRPFLHPCPQYTFIDAYTRDALA